MEKTKKDRFEKMRKTGCRKRRKPDGERRENGWRKEGARCRKRRKPDGEKREAGWRKEGSRMEKRGRPDGEKEEGRNREKKRCRMEKKGARADTEINLGVGPNFAPSP